VHCNTNFWRKSCSKSLSLYWCQPEHHPRRYVALHPRPCAGRLGVHATAHPKSARCPSPRAFSPDDAPRGSLIFPKGHAPPVARAVPQPGRAARSSSLSRALPVRAQAEERRTTATSLLLTSRVHEPHYLSAARPSRVHHCRAARH
jgi:hypothetical protein